MDFLLSAEQQDFQRGLRRFLAERSPLPVVREVVESERGYDPALWSQMSEQLGLPGLIVPEEYGGAGASMLEAALVMEELGRSLVPSPYFATTALGVVPILAVGTEDQKQELLPALAAGERTATLAMSEQGGVLGPEGVTMQAVAVGEGVTLTGTKAYVIDGHSADVVVVAARAPGSADIGLYLVDADAAGLKRSREQTLDLTRPMATLEFDATPAVPLGEPISAARMNGILDVASTLLAAEMVGGMEAAMMMAVEYAKVRHQFNRPIGSFQAIKHRCAEMAVETDASRAAVQFAAFAASEGSEELAVAAPLAKATAASAFAFTAAWTIQIHGGIGFTWEQDAHLYYRKAKADEVLLGTTTENWLTLADRIGL